MLELDWSQIVATQVDIQQTKNQQQAFVSASSLAKQSAQATNALIIGFSPTAQTQPQSLLGTIIQVAGAFAIAGYSFITGKQQQQKAQQQQQRETDAINYVDQTLNTIFKAGEALISQGLNPQDPSFEVMLSQSLYNTVGYKGNCNIDLLGPALPNSSIKPLWLQVTGNGTQLQVINQSLTLPPNFLSYWSSQCQAIHSQWLQDWVQQTITNQQQSIKQQEQQSITKATLISGGVLGSLALIFLVSMIYYSTKVK